MGSVSAFHGITQAACGGQHTTMMNEQVKVLCGVWAQKFIEQTLPASTVHPVHGQKQHNNNAMVHHQQSDTGAPDASVPHDHWPTVAFLVLVTRRTDYLVACHNIWKRGEGPDSLSIIHGTPKPNLIPEAPTRDQRSPNTNDEDTRSRGRRIRHNHLPLPWKQVKEACYLGVERLQVHNNHTWITNRTSGLADGLEHTGQRAPFVNLNQHPGGGVGDKSDDRANQDANVTRWWRRQGLCCHAGGMPQLSAPCSGLLVRPG